MKKHQIIGKPLSSREMSVLQMLANGLTYSRIQAKMNTALREMQEKRKRNGLPPLKLDHVTMENLHATLWIIRQKTGIVHTQDKEECRAVLRRLMQGKLSPPRETFAERDPKLSLPTPKQMTALRMQAQGASWDAIGAALEVSADSAQNYARLGTKRVLGKGVPPWKRPQLMREWLARREPQLFGLMGDPMF